MKKIYFPHSKHKVLPLVKFLGAWIAWAKFFYPNQDWKTMCMPRLAAKATLDKQLKGGNISGVDCMCRFLVPNSFRDVMQATNKFLKANISLLQSRDDAVSPRGRSVKGVRLREEILEHHEEILKLHGEILSKEIRRAEKWLSRAAKNEELPDDLIGGKQIKTGLPVGAVSPVLVLANPHPSKKPIDLVEAFVESVEMSPFYLRHKCLPVSSGANPIYGWGNRLCAYFWRNPQNTLCKDLKKTSLFARKLSKKYNALQVGNVVSIGEQRAAEKVVGEVFKWGGMTIKQPSWNEISNFLLYSLGSSQKKKPKINSSWSKVLCFATQGSLHEQVIWDSRVATSVTYRLDEILRTNGYTSIPIGKLPTCLPRKLGKVNVGRGGTRPRKLHFRWPNGYANWDGQFAGTEFVRAVKDYLNNNITRYPKPSCKCCCEQMWTLRQVEQVLFMDGY
jgi:hypothetical protein